MASKLGMTATERKAVMRNQASELLWYGKIETTLARAKNLRSYVEKIITLAINTYGDVIETTETTKDKKGKETTQKVYKDGVKKLSARRKIMGKVYDIQERRNEGEGMSEFKKRTEGIQHPLISKIFDEIAPKYAQRAEELKQKGGYTRIYRLGERRGDCAEKAIIELVD